MAGTVEGGKKAARTNIKRYGRNFYAECGRKGGIKGHSGGFASNRALASVAGAKGGSKSRRCGPTKDYPHLEGKIRKFIENGGSITACAKKYNVPYGRVRRMAREGGYLPEGYVEK